MADSLDPSTQANPIFSLDVRGMIVEDQLDRRMGRIGSVEKLEEFDEFAAAVAVLDEGVDLAGEIACRHPAMT